MKNSLLILFLSLISLNFIIAQTKEAFKGKTIQFQSLDDVTITADLYLIKDKSAPFIILYHQATFSRGEYRSIAPELNKLGFNCLAIDQRSGSSANGIKNLTAQSAKTLNKKTKYVHAAPDVEAAFLYTKDELKAKKIIVWGSSYSAALVFWLGNKYPKEISGTLAFSPGQYFTIENKSIADHAKGLKTPVFIASAKNEKKQWEPIYDNLTSPKTFFLPTSNGFHGSKALWPSKNGNQAYWNAIKTFLLSIK